MQDQQKECKREYQEIQPRDHTRNDHGKKVRSMQTLGQNRLTTLLDKKSTIIHDQDKIIERIDEFYSELYDSEQSTIIYTVPKEVPEITSWEVEAALRDKKNRTATGNGHINIDTLTAGGYHLEDSC